jgi:uncharacterized repeat protein (TIGR01451 family)
VVADLSIVKGASVPQVGAGTTFDWVLEVTNLGPATAVGVSVTDVVPSSLTVTGVTSTFFDCTRSGNTVTCTRPSLAVDASGLITITVSVPASATSGTIENVGEVGSQTPDPNLSNNTDDASVTVVAQIPPTTITPILPPTGSNSTSPMVKVALVLLLVGAASVTVTRRRREDTLTSTD